MLVHWIVNWLLSALALWLVAQIIPGIQIRSFGTALLATVVLGLVDITIGPILRFIAFPITFLTLGLFEWVLKALPVETGVDLHAGLPDRRLPQCPAWLPGADGPRHRVAPRSLGYL